MLLTVEVEISKKPRISKLEIGEVAICLDEESIELLEKQLAFLKKEPDHVHLMTPSWAGDELTEEKQGDHKWVLVNHLRIVRY